MPARYCRKDTRSIACYSTVSTMSFLVRESRLRLRGCQNGRYWKRWHKWTHDKSTVVSLETPYYDTVPTLPYLCVHYWKLLCHRVHYSCIILCTTVQVQYCIMVFKSRQNVSRVSLGSGAYEQGFQANRIFFETRAVTRAVTRDALCRLEVLQCSVTVTYFPVRRTKASVFPRSLQPTGGPSSITTTFLAYYCTTVQISPQFTSRGDHDTRL